MTDPGSAAAVDEVFGADAVARCRLAIAVGDALRDASTGARFRALNVLTEHQLARLLGAIRLELRSEGCDWCGSAHQVTTCPEISLDLALALYES
ncbi:MAG TPA: hypothetical protein VFA11_10150 [Acidimicrobiales bacterium]|nr:hypothetical protein [Acidimicrobiales bacterium]